LIINGVFLLWGKFWGVWGSFDREISYFFLFVNQF